MLSLPGRDELIWKSWSDSPASVVFHPRSGQTHFVDELSASVLRSLASGCHSFDELVVAILSEFDLGPELRSEVTVYVEKAVQRFREIGLVDRSRT